MTSPTRLRLINQYLCANKHGSFHLITNSSLNSRGVAILVNRNLPLIVHGTISDPNENFLLLNCTITNIRFTLGAVYIPTINAVSTITELKNQLISLGNEQILLGGDFNVTPTATSPNNNIDLEKHTGHNIASISALQDLIRNLNLTDPFRLCHPTKRDFSFRVRKANGISKARLDFFLVSNRLTKNINDCSYIGTPNSFFDHSMVSLVYAKSTKKPFRLFISDKAATSADTYRATCCAKVRLVMDHSLTEINPDTLQIFDSLLVLHNSINQLEKHLSTSFDKMLENILLRDIDKFNDLYSYIDFTPFFETWNLTLTPPAALQLLMNDIKNTASDISKKITLNERRERDFLEKKLNHEKNAPNYSIDRVNELESKLSILINNSAGCLRKKTVFDIKEVAAGNCAALSAVINKKNF